MKNELLLELTKILEDFADVEFAYIFGSYADNTFNERSDIDIAVFFKEYDFDIHLSLSFKISQATTKDTDLVVLNKARNLYLLDDIIRKGIVLKDSPKRVDFELLKHHQILDYKEFKKRIDAA